MKIWHGPIEGKEKDWLRWCDDQGEVIPTGAEANEIAKLHADKLKQRAEKEKQIAKQEKQRAERLAAQLRALGVEPEA